jgi:TusA-related sulfurtransferase
MFNYLLLTNEQFLCKEEPVGNHSTHHNRGCHWLFSSTDGCNNRVENRWNRQGEKGCDGHFIRKTEVLWNSAASMAQRVFVPNEESATDDMATTQWGSVALWGAQISMARRLRYLMTKTRRTNDLTKSDFHLDLRGNISPLSLLKATKALSRLGGGQRLEIVGTDDETKKELLEILDSKQFQMIKLVQRKTFYRIIFEKTAWEPDHEKTIT